MFIHIGNDTVIQSKDVVTIIDRNVITSSSIMEEMMDNAKKKNVIVSEAEPADTKSVVITTNQIYFSTLSVPTLKKRASMISTISKLDDYSEEIE
ncbi:extracellular matrix regulator RemB [Lentibacillus sp. Marseille-P4043]|uniref:extracellular matrix regulator RemB n=1 Tax=Lentibacillus sp. Marseille-P4043 TaxID=2040293 RepID=UPI000D0ADFF9|nr:extracellular matrix/biofilm biosynthesis regulator RemA family protein [Lentibacillus sp. Marseille-P4043]